MGFGKRRNVIVSLLVIFLAAVHQVHATLDDTKCKGAHIEVTFPRNVERSSYQNAREDNPESLKLGIKWRHELLVLVLQRHDIVPEGAVSEWRENNITHVAILKNTPTFYQGRVQGKKFSFVAVSLSTEGLSGYIQSDREGIHIEPLVPSTSKQQLGSHVLRSCGMTLTPKHDDNNDHDEIKTSYTRRRFRRRVMPTKPTKYLEVLIVADTAVVKFLGTARVKDYLLGLMNIVNTVYHDPSLGTSIEVVTAKIMFLDTSAEKHILDLSDPKRSVDMFCQWASTQSYRNVRAGSSNHDVAVLLTRAQFGPAGYAPITGLCVPMRNCALVRDDGFTSAFVIAHEVGHIFGLMHDGHGNNCRGREYATSIMATMVQSSFNHYWWSGCSKARMLQVIGSLNCLNNNPYNVVNNDVTSPLGMDWTLDEQCRLEFGERASHCRIFVGMDPCAQMWCADGVAYSCKTKNVVPLEGSQCGPSPQWYCKNGACSYHGTRDPIAGGWSGWTEWSSCNTDCGIGLKRRSRVCDSPKPQYNGKPCDGSSENTDTCKAKECENYEDPRAQQCNMMNSVPIQGATHIWLPYQVQSAADRCKLTCVSGTGGEVMSFDILVDNGTPCSYDDPYGICIDEICQRVGCDGVRDSDQKIDSCGICGGDDSQCKTVSGIFNKTFEYSAAGAFYETILVLPKGSRDIEIAETYTSAHFLSLQETSYYSHVINGKGQQGTSKDFVLEGAWVHYTNNGGHETIKTKGPLHRDVHVMIYPMDWQKAANVKYSYTVTKDDHTYERTRYEWKYEDWSPCSVTCGKGVQRILYGCYDKETEKKVDDNDCQYIEDHSSVDVICDRINCNAVEYQWRMMREFSECSASCGEDGLQHQLYECERMSTEEAVEDEFCIHVPRPMIIQECNVMPCHTPFYKWNVTSTWSDCSATCGETGTQYQLFYCSQKMGEHIQKVSDRFCADIRSPKEPRPCNRLSCESAVYKWKVASSWSRCSATCGDNGTQYQLFYCVQQKGGRTQRVSDKLCSDIPSPKELRPCKRPPCVEYTWMLSNSWQHCDESCGEAGVQWRKIVCKKVAGEEILDEVGAYYCKGDANVSESRPCNRRICFNYNWETLPEWSECSETCGSAGMETAIVICKNITYDDRETRVDEKHCTEADRPSRTRPCNRVTCDTYAWVGTDQWTNCSASCGVNGLQRKVYECSGRKYGLTVDDVHCTKAPLLKKVRQCNRIPCYKYEWKQDDWKPECQTSCDKTFIREQTTKIRCVQRFHTGTDEETDGYFCEDFVKPVAVRSCMPLNCSTYLWEVDSDWTACSSTCGEQGIQTQVVTCVEENHDGTKTIASLDRCEDMEKPIPRRPCRSTPCVRYGDGSVATWSQCSVTCGEGSQTQVAPCLRTGAAGHEERVESSVCVQANITATLRACDAGPCELLEWGVGPWSMCSMTCGPGLQKRQIYCGRPTSLASHTRCPGEAPNEYQKCENEPCSAKSRPTCSGDRVTYCSRASRRLCKHPAYVRVCCASCKKFL